MDKVFGWLPYALAIMLTTSFTKGFCTFTDRVFISPSVPTDNFDLPMENWFTICTDRTDGQGFWGLPYALAIMLTTSFTKGFCIFTDRVFISPSVPTDTDGRNNFTKLTVGMLASVLDNPPKFLNTQSEMSGLMGNRHCHLQALHRSRWSFSLNFLQLVRAPIVSGHCTKNI